jgi:hypothetical protein
MSEPPADPRHHPRQGSGFPAGCVSVLLIFCGAFLLLPGMCGSEFVRGGWSNPLASAGLALGGVGLAMLALGLILLVWKLLAGPWRR